MRKREHSNGKGKRDANGSWANEFDQTPVKEDVKHAKSKMTFLLPKL